MPGEARAALDRIQQAWLANQPSDMRPFLHPDVVMAYPGFGGYARGADTLIGGFEEFCSTARIRSFEESDVHVTEVADAAVITYRFSMVYERAGATWESTGRDLWVFAREGGQAVAIWRTMLDLEEREL